MTDHQPEVPEYPVAISYDQLRQPPDLSFVTDIRAIDSAIIRLWCTEAQFATLCAGDMRDYLSLETYVEEPYSWTIRVRSEEGVVGETMGSPQERCIRAWLDANRPDWRAEGIDIERIALEQAAMTVRTLYFLIRFYDILGEVRYHQDDGVFLSEMQQNDIRIEDIAILPPAPNNGG